jgi:hypothetical protein
VPDHPRCSTRVTFIEELRAAGVTSRTGLAKSLTEKGIPTPRGSAEWTATQLAACQVHIKSPTPEGFSRAPPGVPVRERERRTALAG